MKKSTDNRLFFQPVLYVFYFLKRNIHKKQHKEKYKLPFVEIYSEIEEF